MKWVVSVLYREPKLLKGVAVDCYCRVARVSVLYREPKLLKAAKLSRSASFMTVSVLYREPKLLKANNHVPIAASRPFQCSTVSRNC